MKMNSLASLSPSLRQLIQLIINLSIIYFKIIKIQTFRLYTVFIENDGDEIKRRLEDHFVANRSLHSSKMLNNDIVEVR